MEPAHHQGALAGLSIKSLPRQEVAENDGGGHDNDNGYDGGDDNNHRRCHPSADRLHRGRRLAQGFLRSRRDHGRPVLGDGKAQDHGRCRRRSGRLPDSQEHAARLRHGRAGAALPTTRHEGRAAGHRLLERPGSGARMPPPHQAAGPRKDSVQASSLELYGALVARGVNPDRRPWAKKLLAQFSTLIELRWLSWRRLMNILDMGVTLGLENPAADHPEHEEDDDNSADEEEPDAASERKGGADDGAEEKKSKNGKTPATAAEAAAAAGMTAVLPPVVRKPPALSRGEVAVLEALYAVGSDAPPIRKQALDFGLGLDAAGQLENEGILTSSKLTESNITSFQTKLKVPGKSEAEVKSALMAMVSNKKGVPADQQEDDDPLFGSYDTNEELVAAAGGGMALYGVNFFPNENDVTLKPYAPILKKPTFVEMAGASASFEASVLHSTEQSMASNFTKTTENGGISIAQSSSTSWGVSASVSSFGGAASASVSADSSETEEGTGEAKGSNAFSANNKTTTTSATTVETITCPMKSFRIPVSTMTMTEEALDHALEVDTLLKAGQFLDTFGSHVSNGRHLLGGIFFRTMTMTTESEVDTSTLLAAASTQMQQSRTESSDATASAGAGTVGVSVAASATMNSASSSGVVKFHATAGHSESESEDSRAMFHSFVR
ncbi:unnamed protein product, partial [Ectocarpus sp. 8 AP-2014]